MIKELEIMALIKDKGVIKSIELARFLGITRQYASQLLTSLVNQGKIVKSGSTRSATYMSLDYAEKHSESFNEYKKKFVNKNFEEHEALEDLEKRFVPFKSLPENIKSIFTYAFLEMLNNAIDHSCSNIITVRVSLIKDILSFVVGDNGIGVYKNIMQKRHLSSDLEAIQDLLKGKITTAPKLHSGEGIFFTSKVGDIFVLNSFGRELKVDNVIKDTFVSKSKGFKRGTEVSFSICIKDLHHLNDIFREYTDQSESGSHGFDKTIIRVRLYTMGGVHISRSQARRVLSGLEKFKLIVMDYDRVPMVGQAFADEIYRVFRKKYPHIRIVNKNTCDSVEFMINRAIAESESK